MSGRQPDGAAGQRHHDPEVVEALQTLEARGIFDPWAIDDILVDEVVPELRAIRALLESGQLPGSDGPQVRSLTGLLEEIERNTSAVVAPEFNRQNLPIGLVGEAIEAISEGKQGQASFTVEGSQFTAEVTASGEIDSFDPIVVFGEGNQVRPIPEEVSAVVTTQTEPRQPTYRFFNDISVTETDFDTQTVPFVARSVVLFFDAELRFAFIDPEDNDDVVIVRGAGSSPFSLSGVKGLFTNTVWFAKPAGGSDVNLDLLFVR